MIPSVAVALLLAGNVVAETPTPAALRASFERAFDEARNGRVIGVAEDEAQLQGYLLHPYLEAARLERALARRDPDAPDRIEAFLAAHGDEPVTYGLRAAWLSQLAESSDWAGFLEHYVPGFGGPAYACQAIDAQIHTGAGAQASAAAIQAWLTPRSAPDTCDSVFDWLRSQGLLTEDLIEQRARLALADGETRLARWLARSTTAARAESLQSAIALLERPQAAIDQWLATDQSVDEDALLAGWTRLARRDRDGALARYASVVRRAEDTERARSRYAKPLALALAWSRRPEALEYFDLIAPADYDVSTYEWHVRAALWAEDWERVERVIRTMPGELANDTRWRYWEARAAERLGDEDRARQLLESVVPTDNYYALQAAARLGQRYTPVLEPMPIDPEQVDALEKEPALARARELFAIGEPTLANREWRYGYQRLDDAQRVHAAGLAARWGWHFQSIATAAQLAFYNDYPLLYPRPFDPEVQAAARVTGLPDALIYGVIRQESLYQPYAESPAGALGLMQLLPSTAARTARSIKLRRPTRGDLKEPAINVRLGAATLRELVEQFDGRTELALAGYNAGPGAARRWLPERPVDADVWIENIPYNETRAYVQRVLWHGVVFAWLDAGQPQDVSALLARIEAPAQSVAAISASAQ
jgi:soluble lytic murein transglycosylase